MSNRVSPQKAIDDGAPSPTTQRSAAELVNENQALRVELANLAGRIAQLEAIDKQLASVGDVRALCDRFSVIGIAGDAAARDALQIAASSLSHVSTRDRVLYAADNGGGGIAGVVSRVEAGGATVTLITDKSFGVQVGFSRFVQKGNEVDYIPLTTPRVLARGAGNGRLVINNLSWQQAKDVNLQPGDWVVLNDDDWPAALTKYRIGRVESIVAAAKGAGYPIITVAPAVTLTNLRDVLVMDRH